MLVHFIRPFYPQCMPKVGKIEPHQGELAGGSVWKVVSVMSEPG